MAPRSRRSRGGKAGDRVSHASVACGVVGAKEVWRGATVSSFSPQMLQARSVEIRSKILQHLKVAEADPNVAKSEIFVKK